MTKREVSQYKILQAEKDLNLPFVVIQTGLSKQCRPRQETKICSIRSGSKVTTTHPAVYTHMQVNPCHTEPGSTLPLQTV